MTIDISTVIDLYNELNTPQDVLDQLLKPQSRLYETLSGPDRVELAKSVKQEIQNDSVQTERTSRDSTILETLNNTILARITPQGNVYCIGDVIQFETTYSGNTYGSNLPRSFERQIDSLGEYSRKNDP